MKYYLDTDVNRVFTEDELREQFAVMVARGDTFESECDSFDDYIETGDFLPVTVSAGTTTPDIPRWFSCGWDDECRNIDELRESWLHELDDDDRAEYENSFDYFIECGSDMGGDLVERDPADLLLELRDELRRYKEDGETAWDELRELRREVRELRKLRDAVATIKEVL